MTSQFNQELAHLSQLYANITDSTQSYADLLIHMLHEYTHSDQAPQLFQTLVQHLTDQSTSSESIVYSLHQDCAFELFPALVTAFDADPVTFTAVFTAMVKHGRPRELLLLIQEQWSAHPSQYALNNLLLTCAHTLLERLGEKSASHLDALARASVKLLCQVPARDDDDHEQHDDDEQVLAVQTLNAAEQLRNNRTTRHEDDSLKHISQYLDHVLDVLEYVTASCQQLSSTVSKAIFRLLELLLPYLETLPSRATLLIVRTVPRVQEFMQLLKHGLDTHPHVIGGYLYLLYLRSADLPLEIVHRPPLVYAPRHVIAASVPYWTALLSTDSPRVRQCGVHLITWCTSEHVMVSDLELGDFKRDTSEDITQHPALLLAQAIVDYVVRCEDQQKRIAVFNSLNDYLTLFCERDHYALLIALIAHCPYPHVSAAFIDQYRKLLPHVTADSPFMKHLVDNLMSWLTARDLVTGRDMLNAALSLTRLSLLNRHVSESAALHAHHVELLNCVKRLDEQLVVEIRREISNSDWEAQRETASLMTRQGLSSMSARDIDVAQQQHIVQLQMIHSLVTRVIELLNEARDTQP